MSDRAISAAPSTDAAAPQQEDSPAARPLDETLQKALDRALYAGGSPAAQALRNFLNGTWLGEPLHAALTDLPIGAWTAAMIFDAISLLGSEREASWAADTSIAIGLAGAAGSAATGLADWSDVDPPARRTGLIHAALNISATTLFATSLVLRKRKARTAGRITGALGYAVMSYAAHLGGEMVYDYRAGVDHTDGQPLPESFVPVMAESDLPDDKPARAVHNNVPILLVRRSGRLFAMAETCSHFGGPLSEGKLEDDSIVCPWHNSRFALADGRVLDGPAVHPQPCLEARARDGKIEVRRRPVK